eukprot:659167-Rhodomonas_salina.3
MQTPPPTIPTSTCFISQQKGPMAQPWFEKKGRGEGKVEHREKTERERGEWRAARPHLQPYCAPCPYPYPPRRDVLGRQSSSSLCMGSTQIDTSTPSSASVSPPESLCD